MKLWQGTLSTNVPLPFPFRKKDHNRAEAFIVAEYGRLRVLGQGK
jgi:hypothetical protein